jgi:hypothetical protein
VELNVGEQPWSVLQAIETGLYHTAQKKVEAVIELTFLAFR